MCMINLSAIARNNMTDDFPRNLPKLEYKFFFSVQLFNIIANILVVQRNIWWLKLGASPRKIKRSRVFRVIY